MACRRMGIDPMLGVAPPPDVAESGTTAEAWGEAWCEWARNAEQLSSSANLAPLRDMVGDFPTRWRLLIALAALVMTGQSYDARERVAMHAIARRLVPELRGERLLQQQPGEGPPASSGVATDAVAPSTATGTDAAAAADGTVTVTTADPPTTEVTDTERVDGNHSHARLAAVEKALALQFASAVLAAETKKK